MFTKPRFTRGRGNIIFVNNEIRASTVRTIDEDGSQLGIFPLAQALRLARERGRDLVCVAPHVIPPVCRILDYGKYRYEVNKREKEAKKKQHTSKLKEIKLRPTIEEHDFLVKLRQATEFLTRGYKLRLTLTFRGRELVHQDFGRRTLEKMIENLQGYGIADGEMKKIGRRLTLVLNPSHSRPRPSVPAPKGV